MDTIIGTLEPCGTCDVLVPSWVADSHAAGHRRTQVLHDASMITNARGVDYQPGQRWSAKHSARRAGRRHGQR